MTKAVGIDFGTTNSVIATMEGSEPSVIDSSEGPHTTPAMVAHLPHEVMVGEDARREAYTNPDGTMYSVNRFIGRRYNQLSEDDKAVRFRVVRGPNEMARFEVNGKQYSPEEISSMVMRKQVHDAESYLGEPVTQAVITVPVYFDDDQRQATKDAARIAGLDVQRIIDEPTAVALAYGRDTIENDEKVLVFHLGGGTLDVSILEVGEGQVEVRATASDTHLGGDDFDRRLVDWLAGNFQREQGVDLLTDRMALQRLFDAAQKAKVELSSSVQTEVNLPFIARGANGKPLQLNQTVTRSTFEGLTEDLVQRCVDPVRRALADAGTPQLDMVILAGGATQMPAVRDLVHQLTGKEPNNGVIPDEVAAVGAAVQAARLLSS
jgi:molecular chaperone DnaK